MKHLKFAKAILILACAASLAGCGNLQKDTGADAPSYSQNPDGDQSADTSNASNDAQELLDSAALIGSVTDFQEGSFQVMADRTEDNGQTAVGAAPGMESESGMESTTVSYGGDCVFQIANLDSSTGAVDLADQETHEINFAATDLPFDKQYDPEYKHGPARYRKNRGSHAGKNESKGGM